MPSDNIANNNYNMNLESKMNTGKKKSINKKLTINLVRIFKDKWFVVYDDYKFATNVD